MNQRGQALIEWALLLTVFVPLFIALAAFSQWFVIRQQLLSVTKQGALLYSSGRLEIPEVKRLMQRALRRGRPSLQVPWNDIYVGSSRDNQESLFKLDRVSVRFHPQQILLRYFTRTLEESCVIKHAPQYGHPGKVSFGPPVPWQRT